MDLLQATNAPEPVELGGESYPVRTLRLKEWAEFQGWLMRQHPGPVARAALALQQLRDAGSPVDPTMEELLLDHAQRESLHWPPRVGSRAWLDAVDSTVGGLAELVRTVLEKTVPGFDRKQAEALAEKMETGDAERLLDVAVYGIRPAPAKKAEADPAASPVAGPSGPSPTSGAPSPTGS